jgi:hypothetical protein
MKNVPRDVVLGPGMSVVPTGVRSPRRAAQAPTPGPVSPQ